LRTISGRIGAPEESIEEESLAAEALDLRRPGADDPATGVVRLRADDAAPGLAA
jgi:hypothetical protein